MNEIFREWTRRARRKGITAVMSVRHSDEENLSAPEKMKLDVLNFLGRNYGSLEGKRILELGCGIGRFTRELALRASNVTAVDMTLGMLERAKDYTADITNITYINSRITDLDALPEFDIVFETITLLHILDEKEYRKSLEIMKSAAPYIFICEHMADSAPVSPYSKLRTFEQYEQDFKPFKLIAYDKNHYCAGDWFPMMLFKK